MDPIAVRLSKDASWKSLLEDTNRVILDVLSSHFGVNKLDKIDTPRVLSDIFPYTYSNKLFHSIAGNIDALYFQNKKEMEAKYKIFINIQTKIEFCFIDIIDSLETLNVRDIVQSEYLYNNGLLSIFKNQLNDYNIEIGLDVLPKRLGNELKEFLIALNTVKEEIISPLNSIPGLHKISDYCQSVLKGYSFTEIMMHERDVDRKNLYLNDFISSTNLFDKDIPGLLRDQKLKETIKDAFGSPLGESAILFSLIDNKDISENEIEAINEFYLYDIPWLHVCLDDLIDVFDDQRNQDPNIVYLLSNLDSRQVNKHLEDICSRILRKSRNLVGNVSRSWHHMFKVITLIDIYLSRYRMIRSDYRFRLSESFFRNLEQIYNQTNLLKIELSKNKLVYEE